MQHPNVGGVDPLKYQKGALQEKAAVAEPIDEWLNLRHKLKCTRKIAASGYFLISREGFLSFRAELGRRFENHPERDG
jgi:hypothetical protein